MWGDVGPALLRGRRFLLGAQHTDGLWRDYALPVGASDAWITGVVGSVLAQAPIDRDTPAALCRAAQALHGQLRPKGWGYNRTVAVDADSTAWVLRLLGTMDALAGLDAQALLRPCIGPGGQARTFCDREVFGTWAGEHADVTPVVGLALLACGGEAAAVAQLQRACRSARNAIGTWRAFWWTSDAYAIGRNLEFLARSGGIDAVIKRDAAAWLAVQGDAGSAFEAAQLLDIAVLSQVDPQRQWVALLERQVADGGWPASRTLRVPAQAHGGAEPHPFADERRLMSSAAAVAALQRCCGVAAP